MNESATIITPRLNERGIEMISVKRKFILLSYAQIIIQT